MAIDNPFYNPFREGMNPSQDIKVVAPGRVRVLFIGRDEIDHVYEYVVSAELEAECAAARIAQETGDHDLRIAVVQKLKKLDKGSYKRISKGIGVSSLIILLSIVLTSPSSAQQQIAPAPVKKNPPVKIDMN
jgi:hypothetical protein